MNLIEQIDRHPYLYLREINEAEVSVLRIVIEEAKASGEAGDIEIGDVRIADTRPIVSDQNCHEYEVIFPSYIAYSVLNESYTIESMSEEFSGRTFRT